MSKIERKLWQTLLGIPGEGSTFTYEIIGKDNEDLKEEMNAAVTKTKNVLGENSVSVDSYEPTMSVDPYKADSGTDTFTWLKGIVDGKLTLDNCETHVIDVDLYATPTAGAYPAIKKGVVVEVKSIGGNTEALQIPYDLHYTNVDVVGTFNPTTKAFVAAV